MNDTESNRRRINLNGNGVVPVGVYGTADLDVNDIDVSTILLGINGDEAAAVHDGHIENLNGDGIDDLVLHFREGELEIPITTPGNAILTLTLTGQLYDETDIVGEDDVRITSNNAKSRGKGVNGPK